MTLPRTTSPRLAATDRRAQLLDVALNAFSRKGFDGTTTKEIAAAAGVTEAIVFRHFPTKQALYKAVLESESSSAVRKWVEDARKCIDEDDDEGLIRAIAAVVLDSYRRDPRMERLMLFAALEGQETALNHYRSVAIPIYELLREYIERRQRAGAIVAYQPGAILSAIAGMAQRYALFTQLFGFHSEFSDDEAVETYTRILMDGIRPRTTK